MTKSSQRRKALDALRKLREKFPKKAWYRDFIFSYGKCAINLRLDKEGLVHVENLIVDAESRGKGHGNRAMTTVCKWADQYGITLKLYAERFDNGPLDTSNLVKWYRSFGFKGTASGMLRKPI